MHPRRSAPNAGIAVCVLSILLVIPACHQSQSEIQTPAPIVKGTVYDLPQKQEVSFHLSSSGRLPTGLHGFRLGMSIADAKSLEPNLMGVGDSGLSGTTREGFYVLLYFTENRLFRISSILSDISPKDATAFDRSTALQFGQSDKRVYKGPEADCWVWIDGDVRARYEDREDGDRVSRNLEFELAAYPTMINAIESAPHSAKGIVQSTDDLVRQIKYDWGEPSEPFISKSMPAEVDGLRLGMQPWEVRNLVPGIEIKSISEYLSEGLLLQGGNSSTAVAFWDGRLYRFNRSHENVSAAQFAPTLKQMAAALGTPIRQWQSPELVNLAWEDRKIEISCTWSDSKNNIPPFLSFHAEDKGVVRFVTATTRVPQFKTVSQTKSFF